MAATLPIILVVLALFGIPYRISRGFPMVFRIVMMLIVASKISILMLVHFSVLDDTGLPIILDSSTDAKEYYDFGTAFLNHNLIDITLEDVIEERGASSHLGYFVVNLVLFKACPEHPVLFLRLTKLLLFHIALGVLVNTWRITTTPQKAMIGYLIFGAVFCQFLYYNFRNLKDDMILSLFMIIMAVADRMIAVTREGRSYPLRKMLSAWAVIGLTIWAMSFLRFYFAIAIVVAFALHTVTGRGLKTSYRVFFGGAILLGFLALTTTSGYALVQRAGGASAVAGSADNIYGIFKVFVTPLPWQHQRPILAVPHTFYLFMMAPALWALFRNLSLNLDWKLYVVAQLALVLGGFMQDYEPRKRYSMYPIFYSWIIFMPNRRQAGADDDPEPFDPDAYFAETKSAYA